MDTFTPWSGLIGGLMIGASASLFILLNGRVAGISGITGGVFDGKRGDTAWRVAFVLGIVLGPLLVGAARGAMPVVTMAVGTAVLIVAGLLVGFGTRMGNGCTSGHGVCGLARGSRRSLAATCVFFAIAALTVFVTRHLL